LPLRVDALPIRYSRKTSPHNQQVPLQNERISVLGNTPIEFFKKQNDALGSLSVSPQSKSKNRGKVIWEHRRGEHKSPSNSLNVAPTNLAPSMILEGEDYGLKASINDLHNAGQQSGRVRP
jgi:hypothetical protein